MVSLLIVFELDTHLWDLNTDVTFKNCMFRSVKLKSKNADPDKCKYSGYGIRFDSCSEFSFTDGSLRNELMIWAHLSILIIKIMIS